MAGHKHAGNRSASSAGRKSWWDLWAARIGVITGVVGLLLTAINLPNLMAQRGYQARADEQVRLDLDSKRRERQENLPRLEFRYLTFSPALYALIRGTPAANTGPSHDNLLLGYPIVSTALVPHTFALSPHMLLGFGDVGRPDQVEVTFLLIENRGKSEAMSLELRGAQLTMRDSVSVVENQTRADYAQTLLTAAATKDPLKLTIGMSLGPADGVLIPLFASSRFDTDLPGQTSWTTYSRLVLVPDSVRYVDPADGTQHVVAVRRMQAPFELANGVVGRG